MKKEEFAATGLGCVIIATYAVAVILSVAAPIAIAWVAWHFIAKFW